MNEYKGIYYNDNTEQVFYEGGAHFRYIELYEKLVVIAQKRNKTSPSKNNQNVYIKYNHLL